MMTPKRPYLLRAIHEWILANGKVPYMLVDATQPCVQVPKEHIVDGNIVLNIDPNAVDKLQMGQWLIRFSARFARGYFDCVVPVSAVMGIYTSDTNEGYFFDPDDLGEMIFPTTIEALQRLEDGLPSDGGGNGGKGKGGPTLTLVKS
jgi:stringent starvation protein B